MTSCTIKIRYSCENAAAIILHALVVDTEPKPDLVNKQYFIEDSALIVLISAVDLRMLRVAVLSFYESLILATKVMVAFADE